MKRLWIDHKYPRLGRKYATAFSEGLGEPVHPISWGHDTGPAPRWGHDIFLQYPPSMYVEGLNDSYTNLRHFYQKNKPQQRVALHERGYKVPYTISSAGETSSDIPGGDESFVVRPLRHAQGRRYQITTNPEQWNPESEYISRIFPKAWEYRVFISKGVPIITLLKQYVPEEGRQRPDHSRAWNRSNGFRFVTVRNPDNNRVRWTKLFETIAQDELFREVPFVALDVMLGDRRALNLRKTPYVISEVNFVPLITLNANLNKIVGHYASNSE